MTTIKTIMNIEKGIIAIDNFMKDFDGTKRARSYLLYRF